MKNKKLFLVYLAPAFIVVTLIICTYLMGPISDKTKLVTAREPKDSVIYFYREDCQACKSVKIYVKILQLKHRIVGVNTRNVESQNLKTRFNIQYVPTFVKLKNGKLVSKYTGTNKNKIRNFLK